MHVTYGHEGISSPNKCQTGKAPMWKWSNPALPAVQPTNISIFLCWKGIRSCIQRPSKGSEQHCSWPPMARGRPRAPLRRALCHHSSSLLHPLKSREVTIEAPRREAGAGSPTQQQALFHDPVWPPLSQLLPAFPGLCEQQVPGSETLWPSPC